MLGLSRTRWELCRSRPEADTEWLDALTNLVGALSDSGDNAVARLLYEELVAVRRQTHTKVRCCKLEFAAEQEQEQREREATRRARVEANVRAALLARGPEAEAKRTS